MKSRRVGLFVLSVGFLIPGMVPAAQENRNASASAQTQVTPAPQPQDANAGAADPNEKLKKQKEKGSTAGHEASSRADEKKKTHSSAGKKTAPAREATPSSKS